MTALARILTLWGEPLDDGEVEEIEPAPLPAKLHDSDKCLTPHPPLPDCAACGRPAVCATRSGSCSVSWCDRCILGVLRIRGESIANNSAFLRNFQPLEFLALADSPARIEPVPLPAMVDLASQASREKTKERKKRQRPAPSAPSATTPGGTREPQHSDNVVVTHNPKARRVTSRSRTVERIPSCDEPNISGQLLTRGERKSGPRRKAPAKGA